MTTQREDAEYILNASSYVDLFGATPKGAEPAEHLKRRYRKLARAVHPDTHQGPLCSEAFARLTELYRQATIAMSAGTYGDNPIVIVTSRRFNHRILKVATPGDLCAAFLAVSKPKGGDELGTFCKIAGSAADNDLLQAEAAVLKKLRADGTDESFHKFVPKLIDTFAYSEKRKQSRRANVLLRLEGFYNLAQVRQAYPHGIHALDMAWMWRRLLYVLGYAHRQGVIHGAVLPEHVMILPGQHGLVLVDWCYASSTSDHVELAPIKALVGRYKEWYPEEVVQKTIPSPATDVVMAARCMIALLGGDPLRGICPEHNTPGPIRAFLRGCLQQRQIARPQDAWGLLDEFDELLQAMGPPYYPRRFRPFAMPTGVVS